MNNTNHPLTTTITKAGGVAAGAHKCDDPHMCILEAISVARGLQKTDAPLALGVFDARSLNDSPNWPSAEARTEAMERLGLAMWGMWDWSPERRQRAAEAIVIGTVNRVLPLVLKGKAAECCRAAGTLEEARKAASYAARSAAARAAYAAANAAADYAALAVTAAARAAANAAARATANAALTTAVDVWVSALEGSAL